MATAARTAESQTAAIARARAEAHDAPIRAGVLLFIVSEAMLFAAFFAAYFALRFQSVTWPPTPATARPELPLVTLNTLLLVASSVVLQRGLRRIAAGDAAALRRALALTLALGGAFLTIQAFEFSRSAFGFGDGVFGSTFYTLTGFHGAHVAGGLLALAAVLRRTRRGLVTRERHVAVEAVSYYWHFVDVVWLVLFTTVYVL